MAVFPGTVLRRAMAMAPIVRLDDITPLAGVL